VSEFVNTLLLCIHASIWVYLNEAAGPVEINAQERADREQCKTLK